MSRPPRNQRKITLSPRTAKRISRVVREVEGGDRSMDPPSLRVGGDDGGMARGTFSLPWPKGTTKTVTDATLSAVTYDAKNYFASLTGSGTRTCCIAFVAGEWILIATEC